ncbi:MAG: hypothetical protein V2I35_06285 [Desulfocapsaceae bacterium]|jgi:ornithine cyclodeaminase/alanine dehydrogenase-like protein (mu-crystallin family)|nr:hypothetical protein [Desulfocapsaceae bacterium]
MNTIRVLSGAQIREAVSMKDIVSAVETAFIDLSTGCPEMPVRSHISISEPEGTALFMPSYMKQAEMIGIKTVTLFEENRTAGIPYIQGMVSLFDGKNGSPRALLDGTTITALRTGAASGLASRLLARSKSSICAIFGAGVQGRTQLEAVCSVHAISQAFIFDFSTEASERFAREMGRLLQIKVDVAASPGEAVGTADIICTATNSDTPVFDDRDIRPGVHLNAVGSYKPHVQEIPVETVLRSRLFVDHRVSALEETGDLIIPISRKLMTAEHICAEIGEVAAGTVAGRRSDDEVTLFKSVGVAVQDLAAAAAILRRAEELDIGTVVEL